MADIMLVLQIIFIIITPLIYQPTPVNMAKAQTADKMPNAEHEEAVIVAVTRDGRLSLSPDSEEIQPDAVTDAVKNLGGGRADKTIYLRSDARANTGMWSGPSTKRAPRAWRASGC
jgi:biopolymer transport protein TolR